MHQVDDLLLNLGLPFAMYWWARSVTTENNPNNAAAVRRIAFSDQLPLPLKARALTNLLKGGFHLPVPYEPRDDLLWTGIEVGAQQGLSVKLLSAGHRSVPTAQARRTSPFCTRWRYLRRQSDPPRLLSLGSERLLPFVPEMLLTSGFPRESTNVSLPGVAALHA